MINSLWVVHELWSSLSKRYFIYNIHVQYVFWFFLPYRVNKTYLNLFIALQGTCKLFDSLPCTTCLLICLLLYRINFDSIPVFIYSLFSAWGSSLLEKPLRRTIMVLSMLHTCRERERLEDFVSCTGKSRCFHWQSQLCIFNTIQLIWSYNTCMLNYYT